METNKWENNPRFHEYGEQDKGRARYLDNMYIEHYEKLQDIKIAKDHTKWLETQIMKPYSNEVYSRRHHLWSRVMRETEHCFKAGFGTENVSH